MWTFGPLCSSPICATITTAVSQSDFIDFINSDRESRILIEISAVKRASLSLGTSTSIPIAAFAMCDQPGATQVYGETKFLFANGKWRGRPQDEYRANRLAIPRISQSSDIERTLPLSPETARRGDVALGNIELVNNEGGLDDLIADYSIADRPVRIYYGPAKGDFKNFRLIGEVFGEAFENTLERVTVRLKSTAAYLDRPVYYTRYLGTGGLDGDFGLKDTVRPVLYGQCFNVTPVLINRENWIYQVHDSRIQGVDMVRERGLDFINDGDVADYIALVNAVVPAGHYKTCKVLGLFKAGFSGEPAGIVTCDVRGDVDGSGYVNRTGDILLKIALQRAGLGAEFILSETFTALPTGIVGYYTGQEEKTCANVFNDLLSAVNGWYGSERTKLLKSGYFVDPAQRPSSRSIVQNQMLNIEEVGVDQQPRWQQTVKYLKNWTPMSEDEVSITVDDQIDPSTTRAALLADGDSLTLTSNAVRQRQRDAIIGDPIQTYFSGPDAADDASAVLSRVMALYQETRRRFRVTVSRVGYLINLQDYITIVNSRFGLSAGKKMLVLGTRDDGKSDTVELTVWG